MKSANTLSRFRSGTALYFVAIAGARASYLAALPFVTHSVSPETYGQYALVRVAGFVFLSAVELGTSVACVRFASAADDPRPIFASVWWVRAGLSAALALACMGVAAWLLPSLLLEAALVAASFATLALGDALESMARARLRHGQVTLAHLASGLGELGAIVLFVWWLRLGLLGLALAMLARFAIGLFVLCPGLLRDAIGRPSRLWAGKLLRFGLPASVAPLTASLGALDRWLIERFASVTEVALYHLSSAPSVAVEALEQVLTRASEPYVYGAEPAERAQRFTLVVDAYFAATIATATLVGAAAPELLALVAPPEYAGAAGAVGWLAFSCVLQGGYRIVGMGAAQTGVTRPWLAAGIANLTISAAWIVLAAPYGTSAAAMGRTVGSLLAVMLCMLMVHAAGTVRTGAGKWIVLACALAALSAAALELEPVARAAVAASGWAAVALVWVVARRSRRMLAQQ